MRTSSPFAFVLCAIAAPVVAQSGWVQRVPAHTPPARAWPGLVFDIWRGVHVMFGGRDSASFPFGDTWEWNGVDWVQLTPANAPPPRWGHAMSFDFSRGRVVVFGGRGASAFELGDTWEFDGVVWAQRSPTQSPTDRLLAGMAYSNVRGRVILFGGASGALSAPLQDTWEWDGANWIQLTTANTPPPRYLFAMTADLPRGRVILVGGFDNTAHLADAWTFDGVDWALLPATQSPSPRIKSALVADLVRGIVVQFGGARILSSTEIVTDETWLHDGSDWRRDARPTPIQPRQGAAFSFDWPLDRAVLFGGADGNYNCFGDTWEYSLADVAQWSVAGGGCAGTQGVPQLRPQGPQRAIVGTSHALAVTGGVTVGALFGLGFSDTSWNGNALPLSLAGYGMPGCQLHTSLDATSFAAAVGGTAQLALAMPNDPGLVGVRFFAQALVPQAGANALGAVMSNAVVNVIGAF